ncbi:nuclear transport factor 2 family protein [Mycobacterium syngnathidarum]
MTDTVTEVDILTERENERYRAAMNADSAGFRELACPEMTYAHTDGSRDTLDAYLGKLASGTLTYHRIDHPIAQVLIAGDAAVIVGEMRADLTLRGTRKTIDTSCIAVWVKRERQWQLLAYQPTPKIPRKDEPWLKI